ncbi:MAG: CRISPR-associated endonuclease Cas3'' [Candidatus Krumholzibacteriia bacterium]
MAIGVHGLIAHTRQIDDKVHFQDLSAHLKGVAELASEFGESFGAERWAYFAGLWHDLGKSSRAFQDYIRSQQGEDSHQLESRGRVDHSTAGAQHAVRTMGPQGHFLGYMIAGHHSGLLDSISAGPCQYLRLEKSIEPAPLPGDIKNLTEKLDLPSKIKELIAGSSKPAFALSFFTRMVFSCLVDADFLDTEAFMAPERASKRLVFNNDILGAMEESLKRHISGFPGGGGRVGEARRAVHRDCLGAAKLAPGFFSLTVPTGGGKTLSSLTFGLRHARIHGLRRLIYAIPFTSIIEQNADVFRDAMAGVSADVVLEHHCNVQHEPDGDLTSRLAAENWDAPLVVTTTVQLYESLFADRPSRCRKLHNIAGSVVILDEVQSLPVDLLHPVLEALKQLVHGYGVTVVLCTATQPAVARRDNFGIGIEGIQEIVQDPKSMFVALDRVEVEDLGFLSDEDLADRLKDHDRVLCIVNTRAHAREMYDRLSKLDGVFHLSAQMCPAHRSFVLGQVRERLTQGSNCRLVSTQLIEAGVDIDFPTVYRSSAGLDSIAQAAGRCNRNGKLQGRGKLILFSSEHQLNERFLAETTNVAAQVLPLHPDPLSPETIEHYFRLYYWEQSHRWDAHKIMAMFNSGGAKDPLPLLFDFKKASAAFRLIDQSARSVYVPWEEGISLCQQLRNGADLPSRGLLRQLQRFQVGIPERTYLKHLGRDIELIHGRYAVLINPETHYSKETGLALGQMRGGLLCL